MPELRLCELGELSQIRRPRAEAGCDSSAWFLPLVQAGGEVNIWFLLPYAVGSMISGAANVVLALGAVPEEFLILGTSLSGSWDVSSATE